MSDESHELLEDKPLLEQFKQRRKQGIKDCGGIWKRAEENHKFAAPGESQWPERDKKIWDRNKAAALTFNEIHPIIQHLAGGQMMNRNQRVYVPRNRAAAEWAESLTEIDRAIFEGCDGAQHESTAFYNGPCVGGVGWLQFELDFLDAPDGKLTIREVPIWSVMWPASETREMNLNDRPWHIHGRWLPKAQVRQRWPRAFKKLIASLAGNASWALGDSDDATSVRIPWRSEGVEIAGSWLDRTTNNLWVERYEYKEIEHRFRVAVLLDETLTYEQAQAMVDAGEGEEDDLFEERVLSAEEYERLDEFYFGRTGQELPRSYVVPQLTTAYKYALICGDTILEQGRIPINRWTLLAITGYRFEKPDRVEWRSVVDALREPQQWNNVFLSMLIRFIQANPKGALIYERGLFSSRNEAMAEWSRIDGSIEVKPGTLSGGKTPYRIESGAGSPMGGLLESMVAMSSAAIPRLAGFNPGALGQVGGDLRRISGEVVSQVREAAAASQAILFDSHGTYRRQAGETLLAFVAEFFDEKDIERIIGEMATYRVVRDEETGQEHLVSKIPPKEMWRSANWRVSIQEQSPAPDRMRAQFEALAASGGLKLMLEHGVATAKHLVELIPDLPEALREDMRSRVKEMESQEQDTEATLQTFGQVIAALVQAAADLDDQQKQSLLAALQGGEQQQAA